MLKLIDVQCTKCKEIEEQYVDEEQTQFICSKCGGVATRIFTSFNFKLKYDPKKDRVAWGNEGYATSQYWKEVKKQRSEGKRVKAVTDKD